MSAIQQMFLGSNSITPMVPSAPGTPSGSSGTSGYITLSFSAASSNGSTITNYTVTSSPGGFTGSGGSSPISVYGLTNGTSYTFTATATNGIGTGPPSGASAGYIPSTVADAPTIGSAAAGNTLATVTFTAPGNNGGGAISGYTAVSTPSTITGSGSSSPITVSGLTNGTSYTFYVYATNASGNSSISANSNAVVPNSITVPTAPTSVSATPGNSSATISFTPSSSNGGSSITGYTATSTPSSITGITSGTGPITMTGLTNGTSYTFTVHATNSAGNSSESSASSSIQLKNAQLTQSVSITAYKASGGGAIASYTVRATGTASGQIITAVNSIDAAATETWLLVGAVSDFDVRFTNTSGDPPDATSSTLNTWLNLSSNRFVTLFNRTVGTVLDSFIDVEIRPAGGGSNYGVVSISLEAGYS